VENPAQSTNGPGWIRGIQVGAHFIWARIRAGVSTNTTTYSSAWITDHLNDNLADREELFTQYFPRGPQAGIEVYQQGSYGNASKAGLGQYGLAIRRAEAVESYTNANGGTSYARSVDNKGWGLLVDHGVNPKLYFSSLEPRHYRKPILWDSSGTTSNVLDRPINRCYLDSAGTVAELNFTGQHRSLPEDPELLDVSVYRGCIVEATGEYSNLPQAYWDTEEVEGDEPNTVTRQYAQENKPTINESVPKVRLATGVKNKRVFGVLSDSEDLDSARISEENPEPTGPKLREMRQGAFVSVFEAPDADPDRVHVNSLGEGAIWVCNTEGNLENGDYITTGVVPGFGVKQDDDILHNYTVAKITQDCDFDLDSDRYDCEEFEFEGEVYRKAFVGCTYHCG
jgi:hypothetical protein